MHVSAKLDSGKKYPENNKKYDCFNKISHPAEVWRISFYFMMYSILFTIVWQSGRDNKFAIIVHPLRSLH